MLKKENQGQSKLQGDDAEKRFIFLSHRELLEIFP